MKINPIAGTITLSNVLLAIRLTDNYVPVKEIIVQNDPSSNNNVLVGDGKIQSIVLTPGTSFAIDNVDNLNQIYVKSGDAIVNFLATL